MNVRSIRFFMVKKDITQNQEQELLNQIAVMKTSIPGLLEINFGANISPARSKGYTHALRALLENRDVLPEYAKHEEHVKFVEIMKNVRDGSVEWAPICLDWEI